MVVLFKLFVITSAKFRIRHWTFKKIIFSKTLKENRHCQFISFNCLTMAKILCFEGKKTHFISALRILALFSSLIFVLSFFSHCILYSSFFGKWDVIFLVALFYFVCTRRGTKEYSFYFFVHIIKDSVQDRNRLISRIRLALLLAFYISMSIYSPSFVLLSGMWKAKNISR